MIYQSLLLAAATATATAASLDLSRVSFEQFLKQHVGKHKWNEEEYAVRKGMFVTELARIVAHNDGSKAWKEGLNKFSVMTASEKAFYHGHSKHAAAAHTPVNQKPFDMTLKAVSDLPASVDWRDHKPNVVSSVKDQGHCGSCWAFAAAAVLESQVALSTGLLFDFSPQQIAMCSPNPNNCGGSGGCDGATAEIAFDYLVTGGLLEEYEMGYNAYYGENSACGVTEEMLPKASISGYIHLPTNNYTALMNAVAEIGPISISVDASTFHAYEGGIFDGCNQEQPDINHAVTLMGYGVEDGQKYWTVRNSWSATYGEAGYIRVARSDFDGEVCGMDITPHDGDACDGEDDPVKVCGTCGILFGSAYALGMALVVE